MTPYNVLLHGQKVDLVLWSITAVSAMTAQDSIISATAETNQDYFGMVLVTFSSWDPLTGTVMHPALSLPSRHCRFQG